MHAIAVGAVKIMFSMKGLADLFANAGPRYFPIASPKDGMSAMYGPNTSQREGRSDIDEGYDDGYTDGYDEGFTVGYSEGHRKSYGESFEEGYDEGYEIGDREGYEEGLAEGQTKATNEIASRMLKAGMSVDLIKSVTHLTDAEIDAL